MKVIVGITTWFPLLNLLFNSAEESIDDGILILWLRQGSKMLGDDFNKFRLVHRSSCADLESLFVILQRCSSYLIKICLWLLLREIISIRTVKMKWRCAWSRGLGTRGCIAMWNNEPWDVTFLETLPGESRFLGLLSSSLESGIARDTMV